ncbi:MAG: hypothetical protein LBC83_05585 [Oscillospiraceae bacterium]|jgi:hypothetical protein|nr:hypothetical protein [Oscillospiraceae bacterium]
MFCNTWLNNACCCNRNRCRPCACCCKPRPKPPAPAQPVNGEITNSAEIVLSLSGLKPYLFDRLDRATLANNVSASGGILTVNKAGSYEISYESTFTFDQATVFSFYVVDGNGVVLLPTELIQSVQALQATTFTKKATVQLSVGETLQLVTVSDVGGSFVSAGEATILRVEKIS